MSSSDSYIVHETKPGRRIFPAMMPRRSNRNKGSLRRIVVTYYSIDSFANCPKGTLHCVQRLRAHYFKYKVRQESVLPHSQRICEK